MAVLSRSTRGALAILLACGALLLGAAPAVALSGWGVESPAPGTRLVGPETRTIVGFVDHADWEEIQRFELRFTRDGQPVGVVRRLELIEVREVAPGLRRSRFAATLDPMSAAWFEFSPAPNGHYGLQTRVQYAIRGVNQEPTPWGGSHALTLDVPPPRTDASAAIADGAARTVAVTWRPVGERIRDFTRYVIERAGSDGGFQVVRELHDGSASQLTDTVPADGEYRYRVTVYRASADGGERASQPADTTAVSVHPGAEPPPDDPSPDGEGEGDGQPGGEEAGPGEEGSPAARAPGSSTWRPWVFPSRTPRSSPPQAQPQPQAPRAAPEDDTFDEVLDYGEWPEEWEVTERQVSPAAPASGGTLQVFNREIGTEQILVPVAGGLVFIMFGAHLLRFLIAPEP